MTITEFLLARIGEEQAAARLAQREGAYPHLGDTAAEECVEMALKEGCDGAGVDHLQRWMPARVLAECEAKRQIVERHRSCMEVAPEGACGDLRALASVYADHPDYREEWAL